MKIEFYTLSFDKVLIRYYLMMIAAVLPFYLGQPILAIIAVPIFISAITGIKIQFGKKRENVDMQKLKTENSNVVSTNLGAKAV